MFAQYFVHKYIYKIYIYVHNNTNLVRGINYLLILLLYTGIIFLCFIYYTLIVRAEKYVYIIGHIFYVSYIKIIIHAEKYV